jgi:hypothetical protein
VVLIWIVTIILISLIVLGVSGQFAGNYAYSWENIIRLGQSSITTPLIFIFSFSEPIFANYFSELEADHSHLMHMISIAIVIAVLIPVKHRLEQFMENVFDQKKLEF